MDTVTPPPIYDLTDDLAIEELLKQVDADIKSGAALAAFESTGQRSLTALLGEEDEQYTRAMLDVQAAQGDQPTATSLDNNKRDARPAARYAKDKRDLQKVANFWKKKYGALKESKETTTREPRETASREPKETTTRESKETKEGAAPTPEPRSGSKPRQSSKSPAQQSSIIQVQSLKSKVKEFETLHSLDAYKLHRVCAELLERQKVSRAKELDAQAQLKKEKERTTELQAALDEAKSNQTLLSAYRGSSEQRKSAAMSDAAGTALHPIFASLQAENDKLRYDLSVRCKVLWHLGESQQEAEERVKEYEERARAAENREKETCEGKREEERVNACLTREMEAHAEELQILRSALASRDDQISLLTSTLADFTRTVESLRLEAETREAAQYQLLLQAASQSNSGHMQDLASDNAKLRCQLNEALQSIQSHQDAATSAQLQAARDKAKTADTAAQRYEQHKQEVLELKEAAAKAEEEAHALRKELAATSGELRDLKNTPMGRRIDELEEKLKLAVDDKSQSTSEESRLKQHISSLSSRLDSLSNQLDAKNAKLRHMEAAALLSSTALYGRTFSTSSMRTVSPNKPSLSPLTCAW
ncbi:hypothetical protein DIPPA_11641 [Diplonema papillatum]|nr:hypothetical protein DIPPA_11641 [Diplonema papillatum]